MSTHHISLVAQSKSSRETLCSIQRKIREIAESSPHVEQSFGDMRGAVRQIRQLSSALCPEKDREVR